MVEGIDRYKETEKWLYQLHALKTGIDNLKEQCEDKLIEAAGCAISYDKDKSSPTYKFNSATENIAVDITVTKARIERMEKKVKMLENAIDVLNDREKNIIAMKYFEEQAWWNIAYKVQYSEEQCRRVRRRAVDKLSLAIFGED